MSSAPWPRVAYFCMEFALHDDLPLYAGGLGVLAGDVLRAAADEGAPVVGVGLFWSEGYAHQHLAEDGWPHDRFQPVPRHRLQRLPAHVSVQVGGREIPLDAHVVRHPSHAPLFLLEPANAEDRWITRRLYQGGYGDRVAQEIVLGVGGVRLLKALGHDVDVYHLNEGHAAFAGLELTRMGLEAGQPLGDALAGTRSRLVFTTHTPVMAGNEAHDVSLLLDQGVGLGTFDRDQLVALAGDPFNMTEAGLRLSRRANAVARLHGGTARRMWAHVRDGAPLASITNGVHVPTWQDPRMRAALETGASGGPEAVHRELKSELFQLIRERTGVALSPETLTLGFARRATPYKRGDLLFRDLGAVAPLFEEGRLQAVFAGKAHPDAFDGKGVVAHLASMMRRFPGRVVFLEDYDTALGAKLTRGCDVWLNTPQRPLEASGTSGMKAALNGGLNLSVLDGWWAEACEHGVNGWQFGDGYEGPGQDDHDLHALHGVLLREVLPTWEGNRGRWVEMMRAAEAMARVHFSASRMLAQYRDELWQEPPPASG